MSSNSGYVDPVNRGFLLFSAVGLIPIALSYGAYPSETVTPLFAIDVASVNLTHILRAVMGLYLGMVVLWILGALNGRYTRAALIANAVFMLGLAAGRALSLAVDGSPHFLLSVYLGLEIIIGVTALMLLGRSEWEA